MDKEIKNITAENIAKELNLEGDRAVLVEEVESVLGTGTDTIVVLGPKDLIKKMNKKGVNSLLDIVENFQKNEQETVNE